MPLNLIFNELSLRPLALDSEAAKERMIVLIETFRAAAREGEDLRNNYLARESLAEGYDVHHWLKDGSVDLVQREYFRAKISWSPILKTEESEKFQEELEIRDVLLDGESHNVINFTYLLKGILISFHSSPRWNCSTLRVEVVKIDDDTTYEEMSHMSKPAHADELKLNSIIIKSGKDLANKVDAFYPQLIFCKGAKKQLCEIMTHTARLEAIMKRLTALNDYSDTWKSEFNPGDIQGHVVPESKATLEQYESEHTIYCPDQQNRLFSWHLRVTKSLRIYFFPLETEKKIIIGYFGHMPTKRHTALGILG